MSRKADVSDYSVTQDVLTDIKTPRSIENKLTDTEACNARLVEKVEELREQLRWRLVKEEEPPIDELIIVRGERHMIWSGMQLGHGVIKTQLGEYALWMRIPNVEQE